MFNSLFHTFTEYFKWEVFVVLLSRSSGVWNLEDKRASDRTVCVRICMHIYICEPLVSPVVQEWLACTSVLPLLLPGRGFCLALAQSVDQNRRQDGDAMDCATLLLAPVTDVAAALLHVQCRCLEFQ
ncbi:hypothetical protein GWK47_023759 [Chionoecetes opilio]|uniref:Uncharacterized protein n=1 Tax=Chionoecetes opilio TaxID=41210 RepID=A0A8J4XLX4_CHIOP|nr:hypothetical protein GWK47_023759 [Chionoecetes opilio]